MTSYRLTHPSSGNDLGTYSNMLKVWNVIKDIADGLETTFLSYGRFAGLMKGCESNLYHIKGYQDYVYKVERVVIK
jgi:hypothetical protein